MGHRNVGVSGIPGEITRVYGNQVEMLALALAAREQPVTLTLTADAAELHLDAERVLEPRLEPYSGDLAGIQDWAAKLIGTVLRVAGLLHIATQPANWESTPVSGQTMADAVKLGEYLTAHALAAFGQMGCDSDVDDAKALLNWITRNGLTQLTKPIYAEGSVSSVSQWEFSKRDLFRGVQSQRFTHVDELDRPLALLEQHGYIRKAQAETTAKGGRPSSPRYEVNPLIGER